VELGTRSLEDVVMFGDLYADRRVFVTGHTGFKGSWLTLWLLDLGADVTGYALGPPTQPNMFEAVGIGIAEVGRAAAAGRFTDLRGDVRERRALRRALDMAAPEIVFHLAAQPLVRRSYAEPYLTYETNVMGTVNLLEEVRALARTGRGPRVVVNVTSDKCYENAETGHAHAEGDTLGGFDPYSSSKGCSELVTAAYRRSFFTEPAMPRVATARAGNVVGGGDWGEDRMMPDCARALSAGVPIGVRNPGAIRPWQHVLESLSGYLWLGANLWRGAVDGGGEAAAFEGAWNFGPGADCNVTVREVVDLFITAWGGGEWRPVPRAADQPHEASHLVLDVGKAERKLGWRATWSVIDAVGAAAHWYADFHRGADPAALRARCRADIASYCDLAIRSGAVWATSGSPT
jgi:CDP-glucose 4,6-dehydratase